MILMPQIFDDTTNENARYKRNELELLFMLTFYQPDEFYVVLYVVLSSFLIYTTW